MLSELKSLHDEAAKLLNLYEKYKDSNDLQMRRKVHIRLDKFLMEHRDTVAQLVVDGLQREIKQLSDPAPRATYKNAMVEATERKRREDTCQQ